jgi:hypothetical protein
MGDPSSLTQPGVSQRLLAGAHLLMIVGIWFVLLPLMALLALVDVCWGGLRKVK